jgi:hypothetical protein
MGLVAGTEIVPLLAELQNLFAKSVNVVDP